jgi:hypothetical protein
MKEIPLPNGKYAIVDDEDFDWLMRYKWSLNGHGYVHRNVPCELIRAGHSPNVRMHREIMGFPEGMEIDHANGDRTDNRRCNLRICTKSQNLANQTGDPRSKSGYWGVYWNKGKKMWRANINVMGKCILIGYFETPEEAARARDLEVIKQHGEFARLNFPEDSYTG